MPDLSIVIVSYRTPQYLRRCLQTLDSHRSEASREVLVVDVATSEPEVWDLSGAADASAAGRAGHG